MSLYSIIAINKSFLTRTLSVTRLYATAAVPGTLTKKKKMGKLGPIAEKKEIPVETDVKRLVNYVCGSCITKTGEDIQVKPDSEYPEWLWNLHTGKPLPLEELDPTTKQYWRRLRKMGHRRNNQLATLKKF
uniref:Large ribosomal subunit protein mL54 n=1 Tax=Nyssomyia neivai TaxID=330878 RepID=A0A1L8DSA4_9DIPT